MTTEINQSHCYDLILSLPDKTNKANKIQSKFLTQPTLPDIYMNRLRPARKIKPHA